MRTTAIFAFLILSVLGILAVLWANRLFRSHRQQAISRPPVAAWSDFEERLAPLDLSPREAEIAGLVLHGYSNREIEERLFISLETVKKHVSNIYRKLGVKSRVQLSNFIQNRCGVRPDDVPPARL